MTSHVSLLAFMNALGLPITQSSEMKSTGSQWLMANFITVVVVQFSLCQAHSQFIVIQSLCLPVPSSLLLQSCAGNAGHIHADPDQSKYLWHVEKIRPCDFIGERQISSTKPYITLLLFSGTITILF